MRSGWREELLEKVVACAATFSDAVSVEVFGSSVNGEMDAWSDLDVRLSVPGKLFARMFPAKEWLGALGDIWVLRQWFDETSATTRLVFRDGRRLDLRFEPGDGRTLEISLPEPESKLAGLDAEFRFVAVQAVAKLGRNDLLIGAHLVLELERMDLVVAMLLRDRDLGTTTHRRGGPYNHVVQRIGGPGVTVGDWLDRIERAMVLFGKLSRQLDAGWREDWGPLQGFIEQARREIRRPACGERGGTTAGTKVMEVRPDDSG